MAGAAGGILALSLIVAGLAILGDALGLWSLPGDVFGLVVLLLGTAGKYVKDRTAPKETEEEDEGGSNSHKPPAQKAGRSPGSMWIVLIAPALIQCGGLSAAAQADAATWATCAGAGAFDCAPVNGADSLEEGAISWVACVASKAITCAGSLVQPNPPAGRPYDAIDLDCVTDAAARCLHEAEKTQQRARACVEDKIAQCAPHQVTP